MLASTIQFTNTPPNPEPTQEPPARPTPAMWPPGPNPEPKKHPSMRGCPFRTQQCARPTPSEGRAVYDVSTHELRHHAFGGVTALARPGPLQTGLGEMLLRKEVIQPHLPVRLPCYDFVPIASPTFDHSLRERLGHGLRVLPTFVT